MLILRSLLQASAIPSRVPLGFVCGYPLGPGGELYGGSMFMRSAAVDTPQGRAIQKVNKKWGDDFRKWSGRETIGIPVCKKKYSPFSIEKITKDGKSYLKLKRMYGCHCHSNLRKKVIERYGEREGWEPFGQWSMSKAKSLLKKAISKMNDERNEEESLDVEKNSLIFGKDSLAKIVGSCIWKMKGKCDDILDEMCREVDIIPVE